MHKHGSLPAGTDSWNYRVMRRTRGKPGMQSVTYGVYLCRYQNGRLVDWIRNIAAGLGANFEGLAVDLMRIHQALVLPVLDFYTGEEVEPARTPSDVAMMIATPEPANDAAPAA